MRQELLMRAAKHAADAQLAIAMAANPALRVIRVRDGSLLDEDAMQMPADAADANDYQIWIERVDNTGEVGFVLEDGHIKTSDNRTTGPDNA